MSLAVSNVDLRRNVFILWLNRLEWVVFIEVSSSGSCLSSVGDGFDDAAGEKSEEEQSCSGS